MKHNLINSATTEMVRVAKKITEVFLCIVCVRFSDDGDGASEVELRRWRHYVKK